MSTTALEARMRAQKVKPISKPKEWLYDAIRDAADAGKREVYEKWTFDPEEVAYLREQGYQVFFTSTGYTSIQW